MAELFKVNAPVRKPLFEGVQGENEARSIQFDVAPWVDELGDGVVTATAKRSQDSQPYPVTVTKVGNVVTWKPTSTDTAFAGVGSFQLEYTVDSVLAKTCIWSTQIAPSLDPAGDPPDPYDNWLAEMRQIAANALQSEENAEDSAEDAEAWAVGQRGGVDVPSTDPTYENNSKYWAEQSLANQYAAFPIGTASGSIASFNDGADDVPMKSLKVAIVPKQAGSGDPSPDNVRAISGWTDADVKQRGKNLFVKLASALTDSGVTFTPNADGSISLTGTSSSAAAVNTTGYLTAKELGLDPNKRYVLTGGNADIWVGLFAQVGLNIWNIDPTSGRVFTPSETDKYRLVIYVRTSGIVTNTTVYPMIREEGTDATFEAYTPKTTPVPLGQTVYGGELDVTTGVLTITQVAVDTGTLSWTTRYTGSTNKTIAASVGAANKYNPQSDLDFVGACGEYITYVAGASILNTPDTRQVGFYTYRGSNDTPEDSLYMVLPVNATPSGLIVYNKVTPTTYQLTPAEVRTLLGTNNVWSDAGDVTAEYRKDPTIALANLEALILENI